MSLSVIALLRRARERSCACLSGRALVRVSIDTMRHCLPAHACLAMLMLKSFTRRLTNQRPARHSWDMFDELAQHFDEGGIRSVVQNLGATADQSICRDIGLGPNITRNRAAWKNRT
jgi:hypothetical protein